LRAQDDRPLTTARSVDARLVGVCRPFAVLLVAMVRAKGVPARARFGFGAYFASSRFEDHRVCEYWDAAAALNNMEMLPWDVWGAMPGPERPLRPGEIPFFDRLAALARAPDAAFAELRPLYEGDSRLRVPAIVRIAVLNRDETI
jgi:hypothetical protein